MARAHVGKLVALVCSLTWGMAPAAHAQLGSGWVEYFPTKRIHLDDDVDLQTFTWTSYQSVCNPACADYRYDSATDTEIFRIFDARSNRSEIRLQNEYTTGRRQFQGYLTFFEPNNDPGVLQLWGSTTGATLMIMRCWAASGGSLTTVGSIPGTVATNAYGVELRINVIHDQNNYVRVYNNGSLRVQGTENEDAPVYHKYGAYGNNARAGTCAFTGGTRGRSATARLRARRPLPRRCRRRRRRPCPPPRRVRHRPRAVRSQRSRPPARR
jgi:hypothetical protein